MTTAHINPQNTCWQTHTTDRAGSHMDPQKTLFRPQRYLQSSVTSALRQDLGLPTETLKNSSSYQLPTAARDAELTLLSLLSGGSLLAPPRTCSTALMEAGGRRSTCIFTLMYCKLLGYLRPLRYEPLRRKKCFQMRPQN